MKDGSEIVCVRRGAVGLVTLHQSHAHSILTRRMCGDLRHALDAWAVDPDIAAVVIRGRDDFCGGADFDALRALIRAGDTAGAAGFFRDEYRLIYAIHAYPKPCLTVMDGVVTGAGLALAGAHRVATERTVFALPDAAAGFFPDGGASRFLSRCPGETGVFLGLTGAAITGADTVLTGLATAYLSSAHLDRLVDRLAAGFPVADALVDFESDPGDGHLARLAPTIDRMFAGQSAEAILARLEAGRSTFAAEQAAALKRCAPLSLKVTLRQLRRGRALDLAGALRLEYRLALHMVARPDFVDSAAAGQSDHHRSPAWFPAALEAVTPAMVDAVFAPPEVDEFIPE